MLRLALIWLLAMPCTKAVAQDDFPTYRPPVFRTLDRATIVCDLRKLPEGLQTELSNAPFGHPERAYDYVKYNDVRVDQGVQENGTLGLCTLSRDVEGLGKKGSPIWIVRSLVQVQHLNFYLVNVNDGACLTTSFHLGLEHEKSPRNINYSFITSKTPVKSIEGTFDSKNLDQTDRLYVARKAPGQEYYGVVFGDEDIQSVDKVREKILARVRESNKEKEFRVEYIDYGQIVFAKEDDSDSWKYHKEWWNWVFLHQSKVDDEWFLDDVIFVNVHTGVEASMFNDVKRTGNLLE